jgi:hypothetical protein
MFINKCNRVENFLPLIQEFYQEIKYCPSKEIILFRGQSVDKPLLPKYARTVMTALKDWDIEEEVLKVEKSRFAEFSRRVGRLVEKVPANDWDLLALAQHHGMETRLLDWTENPLVALYFAFENGSLEDMDNVLWLLRVPRNEIIMPLPLSPFNTGRTTVFRPALVSPRMAAQLGWFTVHAYLDKSHRFIPLDRNTVYQDLLGKMDLGAMHNKVVLRYLDRVGINALSLFPDLDGLGKYINKSSDFSYSNWEFREKPRRKEEPEPATSWQKIREKKKVIIVKKNPNPDHKSHDTSFSRLVR